MLIGEAPGFQEEKTGKTFQGESGKLLEKMFLILRLLSIEKISSLLKFLEMINLESISEKL